MGVEKDAFFGYGFVLKVPKQERVTKPACEHPEREGHVFCPKCGKPVQNVTELQNTEAGDLFDELVEELMYSREPRDSDIQHMELDGGVYFVGHYLMEDESPRGSEKIRNFLTTDTAALEQQIREVLSKYAQFFEGKKVEPVFGLLYS